MTRETQRPERKEFGSCSGFSSAISCEGDCIGSKVGGGLNHTSAAVESMSSSPRSMPACHSLGISGLASRSRDVFEPITCTLDSQFYPRG